MEDAKWKKEVNESAGSEETPLLPVFSCWLFQKDLVCNYGYLLFQIFSLQKKEVSRFQKLATNFFRVVSVVMIPVAAAVPSVSAEPWRSVR